MIADLLEEFGLGGFTRFLQLALGNSDYNLQKLIVRVVASLGSRSENNNNILIPHYILLELFFYNVLTVANYRE
jgi:hypothetical protein